MVSIPAYNFKKEFYKEVQEKKRAGRGVFSQKGKRGYVGKVMTTMDFLTGKEKREYTKSGDITIMNIYKQLLPFDDLVTYSPDQQKEILENWRKAHTQKEILNALGVNKNIYYKKLYDLGVLERPESEVKRLNAEKNKRESPSTYKRNGQGEATKEIIVPYGSFRNLPRETQWFLLDAYYDRYTTKSIAKAWDKPVQSLHQTRYQLKKYMTENDIPIIDDRKKEKIYQAHDRTPTKKPEPAVAIESVEEKPEKVSLMEMASTIEKEQKEQEKQPQTQQISSDDLEIEKSEENELAKKFEQLANLIQVQTGMVQGLAERQTMLEDEWKQEDRQQGEEMPIYSEPIRVVESVEQEPAESSKGMNFSFEDEKEGFLLHHELVQFIKVLEKNPDSFKVNIKITKTDGEI